MYMYCTKRLRARRIGHSQIACATNSRIILRIYTGSGENWELLENIRAVSSPPPTNLIIVGRRFFVHHLYKMVVSSKGSDSVLCLCWLNWWKSNCAASLVCTSSANYLAFASFRSCRKVFFLTFKFLWRPTNQCPPGL